MSKPHAAYLWTTLATSALAAAAYVLTPSRPRFAPGSVILITGGSSGLGLALAHRFGRAGFRLILASRTGADLQKAQAELLASGDVADAAQIHLVPGDLTHQPHAAHVIAETLRVFGRLDILLNNAGIIQVGPIEDQPVEAFEQAMHTNFFAALYATHAALPHLLSPRRTPRAIVNIASVGGKIPVPHLLPYVAAKFALTGFSEGLHAELRHKGVRVTTVCPGLMRTGGESHAKFSGQVDKEKQWFNLGAKSPVLAASPQHAAHRIYNAVQAGRAEITITPQAWLAARAFGLAPSAGQAVAALVNRYALPAPSAQNDVQPIVDPSPS